MDRRRPLDSFRDFRPEVSELLETARSRSDEVDSDRRMSRQESHLRHVAVALVEIGRAHV